MHNPQMRDIIDYDHGISAIDSHYVRPQLDAIHLIVEGGRAAVIDAGVNSSVPHVMAALRAKNIPPAAVDYVVLTHIHLDHAGGAGLLLSELPNARLTVHPRGARHMIDPSKLIASTEAVYGTAAMERTYGRIVPVDPARVIKTAHGSSVSLNGRELVFYDTPGHARHHVCVLDTKSGCLFAGDTFGLSYRELDDGERRFIFPTSSPTQFDPEAEHRSLDLIASLKPPAIYLTHYSEVRDIPRLTDDMHRLVEAHAVLGLREAANDPTRHARLKAGITDMVLAEAQRYAWPLERARVLEIFASDIELNAQGLANWLDARD